MRLKITSTTDGRFIGFEFHSDDNPLVLPGGIRIAVDFILATPTGFTLGNSNYIIQAIGL